MKAEDVHDFANASCDDRGYRLFVLENSVGPCHIEAPQALPLALKLLEKPMRFVSRRRKS